MHYSFRNTLCGLAVVIAAGLLADQAAAQTVTLLEDDDTISLSPADEGSSAPEEISLFDEQMGDVSLPAATVSFPRPSRPTALPPTSFRWKEARTTIPPNKFPSPLKTKRRPPKTHRRAATAST